MVARSVLTSLRGIRGRFERAVTGAGARTSMTACPSSPVIDNEPPAASTRSRMWLSGKRAASACR